MKSVSIIIPVYNEKRTIREIIKRIDDVDIGLEKEIIVVDGCSTDGTKEILQNLGRKDIKVIHEEKRKGKGAAIRLGFKEASGDIFLIQDADLEVLPAEYPYLLNPIIAGHKKVVFGSRFLRGRGMTRFGSYIGNQLITWAVNILFLVRLSDIATCHKVFTKEVAKKLHLKSNGFEIEAEITTRLIKNGQNIYEIPIDYVPRTHREGKKLHWRIGFKVLLAIIKFRLSF
ncbi:MAG: glycosyltransferase family 2 protein [Candidatus Omnitrophota bacterium]|jgi:glycosyltransferase involved in cell wall biosynthesis|nr:MAG: glycosyltransferase family 2 protein [Candidatus Omnitrophota bacterium]